MQHTTLGWFIRRAERPSLLPIQYLIPSPTMTAPPNSKEHELLQHAYPDGSPSFTIDHTVDLSHPINKVYAVLGPGDRMERVVRLSSLCSDFFLTNLDRVAVTGPLSSNRPRALPAAPTDSFPCNGAKLLPRQFFSYEESVPIAGGLTTHKVRLAGTQTWDDEARVSVYESVGQDLGILIWKRREFEEIEGGGTRVKERIEGFCPALVKPLIEPQTAKPHRYVC